MPGTSSAALSILPADHVYTCLFEIHEAVFAENVAMSRCTLAYCMWDKVAFVKNALILHRSEYNINPRIFEVHCKIFSLSADLLQLANHGPTMNFANSHRL